MIGEDPRTLFKDACCLSWLAAGVSSGVQTDIMQGYFSGLDWGSISCVKGSISCRLCPTTDPLSPGYGLPRSWPGFPTPQPLLWGHLSATICLLCWKHAGTAGTFLPRQPEARTTQGPVFCSHSVCHTAISALLALPGWAPGRLGLPELAKTNTGVPVKLEFQRNNKYSFSII